MKSRLHVSLYFSWLEWRLWPWYRGKAEPGRIHVGPFILNWYRDWE